MIKITILIPTAYNDKTPVAFSKLAKYTYDIEKLVSGCTIDGKVYGFSETDDGTAQNDDFIKVWVVGSCNELLSPMRAIACWIATDLNRESVYLEWHDVNVEFITPPEA